MDKVECTREDRWVWSCPRCEATNEEDESREDGVECAFCYETFEATFEP